MIAEEMPGRDWSSHPPLLYPDYKSTLLRAPDKATGAAEASTG